MASVSGIQAQIDQNKAILASADPTSIRYKLATTALVRLEDQLARATSTDVTNLAAFDYVGIDPVTGLHRYINKLTNMYTLSSVSPNGEQVNSATPGPNTEPAPTLVVNTTEPTPVNLDKPPATIPPVVADASYDRLENNRLGVTPPDVSYDNLESKRLGVASVDDSYTKLENKRLGVSSDDGSYDKNETRRLEANTATKVNDSNVPDQVPSENVLHNYASYTYGLSLHALTVEDYAKINSDPGKYVPKNVLIASAGRRGIEDFDRQVRFNEDFFFDNLTMTTVIGMSAEARNSNTIEVKFTIIEPYGMTFMNRLINAARDMHIPNFRDMPYLLQIDFYGYDDNGIPSKIKEITKSIPIKFGSFVSKVTTSGATYDIDAFPYNHGGFLESSSAINPIKLEVMAQNIGEFFMANDEPMTEYDAQRAVTAKAENVVALQGQLRDSISSGSAGPEDVRMLNHTKTSINDLKQEYETTRPAKATVKSYAGAMNAWRNELFKKSKVEIQDVIKFEFLSTKMTDAKFPDPKTVSGSATPMKPASETQNGAITSRIADGKTSAVMSINSGTTIIDVIGMALRNSDYIRDQLADPDTGKIASDKNALDWFKIIPRINILGYDHYRYTYAKEYIYRVVPYKVYNTENAFAPLGTPRGWVKEYEYLFTGKNADILKFEINFDALYWTAKTSGNANKDSITGAANAVPSQSAAAGPNYKATEDSVKIKKDKLGVLPEFSSTQVHVANPASMVSLSQNSRDDRASLAEQMMGAAGDLLEVNLKIVGDPDFIKQDDLFYDTIHIKNQRTPNGSIATDEGEIFIKLKFKTPVDYNSKGLADPTASASKITYETSVYSGLYKVLKVVSTFSNGKFEQELNTVRFALQPVDGIDKENQTNDRPDAASANTNPSDLRLAASTATTPMDSLTMNVPTIPTSIPTGTGSDIPSVMGNIKDAAGTAMGGLNVATAQLTQATTALGTGFSNLGAVNIDAVGKLLPTATNAIASGENIINKFKAAGPIKYSAPTTPAATPDAVEPIYIDP
jgi:hypothetical protein